MADLLTVTDVVKHYRSRSRWLRRGAPAVVHGVCGVSFTVPAGSSYGIVGESGSGKTTVLKLILGLERLTRGTITCDGVVLADTTGPYNPSFRDRIAVVFQDPMTSLDPRMTIRDSLREPSVIARNPATEHDLVALLEKVLLPAQYLNVHPHELSGGQRQRVAIARALARRPQLVLLDEPVSALDVSVQAEIIALLKELRTETGVSYLMVSHDLGVVAELCDHLGVMWLGRMVESGPAAEVLSAPAHAYTQRLVEAIPVLDPAVQRERLRTLAARPPLMAADRPACPHPG
ncbi:ABC transporter ATP-binding protein [Amycolatopsis jejuensis]|uniref:ABC transporter ATP-binding protein n=1 Tax=Amycolatopsis jejuensis TaxID=330084 RepID=UPI000AB2CF72|nr:ATP-binding cassette domain-containing protein [Amycolatopsis jejuensis]